MSVTRLSSLLSGSDVGEEVGIGCLVGFGVGVCDAGFNDVGDAAKVFSVVGWVIDAASVI